MKIFFNLIGTIFAMVKIPLILFIVLIGIFATICCGYYAYYYKHGYRLKTKPQKAPKKSGLLKKIFVEAPKRIVLDMYDREPDFFKPQGLIIFTGFQGSGKTSSLVQYTQELQKTYPEAKVISNMGYTDADAELKHYKQLLDYKNGHRGIIVQIDELQNWFNSKQSKNFPPEMLAVVTQNRKNRRVILGTAQNFYMLAKDIRSQCTELRKCLTLCGCITIVHKVKPICNEAGDVEKLKHIGFYIYVHDDDLRGAYDTYKVIDSLSKSGFTDKKVTI